MKTAKATPTAKALAPFNLEVRNAKGGFSMNFKTLTNGERVDVQLDFPQWWADEMLRALQGVR